MREKPSRETSSRTKPFNKKIVKEPKEILNHIHDKEDIKNLNDYSIGQIKKIIKDYFDSFPKPSIPTKHSDLEDDEKDKHHNYKIEVSNILNQIESINEENDKIIKDGNDIFDRIEKAEGHFHEDNHEHKNLDILNKLDPTYFSTNANQFEMIITSINKMIPLNHEHKNSNLLNELDDNILINNHTHENSFIEKLTFEDDKLMFNGKEVCLKDIDNHPIKSFFKRFWFKKGD